MYQILINWCGSSYFPNDHNNIPIPHALLIM